jgi:hypothetical protein
LSLKKEREKKNHKPPEEEGKSPLLHPPQEHDEHRLTIDIETISRKGCKPRPLSSAA